MFRYFLWTYLLFITTTYVCLEEKDCPVKKCVCKRNAQKDVSDFIKVRCGNIEPNEKIRDLEEINLVPVANFITQLNLSENLLTTFLPKTEFYPLQKLDLSGNRLAALTKDQFNNLPNLRKLDISGNIINSVNVETFTNLPKLERLKLNHNNIKIIHNGTFDLLKNLKQLDISNNPLKCSPELMSIIEWSQSRKPAVKLVSNPKCCCDPPNCSILKKLVKLGGDLPCSYPLEKGPQSSVINLDPFENQVVFEGDSFSIKCEVASEVPLVAPQMVTDKLDTIQWIWGDSDPTVLFSDIDIIDGGFVNGKMVSVLSISELKRNHSGVWNCSSNFAQGNFSKGINILVISEDTKYCPMTITKNNKGTYIWPKTIANHTVTVGCESLNSNFNTSEQKALYECSENGKWINLNTTICAFISETTKILEQFSEVNTSIMESAKHFKNYTSNLRIFRDVMDLVFAVKTIGNYLELLPNEQLGGILVDVVNNLMELPKSYFDEANVVENSCLGLLNSTEVLAGVTPILQLRKSNIALGEYSFKKDGFTGMKCTWYVHWENPLDRVFDCSQTDAAMIQGRVIEASITIPETLFHQLQDELHNMVLENKIYKVMVAMHSSNKLFPIDEGRRGKEDVTSAVVGAKLVNIPVRNLTDPIFIMLRSPPTVTYEIIPFIPVWWDPDLSNGTGSWSQSGCQFNHQFNEYLVFSCNQFGYYGLLQDVTHAKYAQKAMMFRMSHPAVYIGSFILFTTLLLVIMTYLLCYTCIQMPKKAKHCLINTWLAICALCFMYVFGIYQTEDIKLCQIIGMLLHYFTLSSLLWMCVYINTMYKRLSKSDTIELQDDELPSDQPIQKPILGLYFVGWGVAMIICGISTAINIKEYSSPTHCFLRSGPALGALYIPGVILFLFLLVFSLLVRCVIYNSDTNGHLSEGTQATENVDLDLLEPNFAVETRSIRSASTKTSSSEAEDSEHAPITQLKAFIIFLSIYVVTWLCCACSTVQPFNLLSFEEDIFSILYALLATLLSSFTLFFYCIARNDVRRQWGILHRWLKGKRPRSRNVSDAHAPLPQIQIQPLPPVPNCAANETSQIISRGSSRSSNHTRSTSHRSNILKGAVDLNGSYSDGQGTKINNVNLLVLHRQQYGTLPIPNIIENPTNVADVFYNPHQSTVARKFFKRQRRNQMKRNNLTAHVRQSSDACSIISDTKKVENMPSSTDKSQSIFGTNSKVNNTNIHVELVRKVPKNPNLFSDSNDDSSNNVSVDNIVINAERLRKKELTKHRAKKKSNKPSENDIDMRSVSQQCTLEYSSENVSGSDILDNAYKLSPEKLPPQQSSFRTELTDNTTRRENSPMNSILTEDDHYAKIQDFQNTLTRKPDEPLPFSSLQLDFPHSLDPNDAAAARIYVNPAHELNGRSQASHAGSSGRVLSSRASSVSVSDLDELYQQIRRGPRSKHSHSHVYVNSANIINSPCLSDSEITTYVSDNRYKRRFTASIDNLSDNVETTV